MLASRLLNRWMTRLIAGASSTDMMFDLQNPGRTPRRLAAFSFIENLIGISVIGVTVVSLFAGFSQGFAIIQVARENLRATQILCEKTEVSRLYTMEQITNNNFNGTDFMPRSFNEAFYPVAGTNSGVIYTGQVTVASVPFSVNYSSNLLLLTFEVSWRSSDVLRRRGMNTLVARDGLQSYIY